MSEIQAGRTAVLRLSHALGWALAVAVLSACVFAAVWMLDAAQADREKGKADAQAFIGKVRACHRAPKPHPSWAECEVLVRARE